MPASYTLAGWDELDLWATRNKPVWQAVTLNCKYCDLSESDRLKMLCAVLLGESEWATALAMKYVERFGPISS